MRPEIPDLPTLAVLATLTAVVGAGCAGSRLPEPLTPEVGVRFEVGDWLNEARETRSPFPIPFGTAVDTIRFGRDTVVVEFSRELARHAFRPESAEKLEGAIRAQIKPYLLGRELELLSSGVPVPELVPNLYRKEGSPRDTGRVARPAQRPVPLVTNLDRPVRPSAALADRYVAMWHSHGWYYEHEDDRWMWQRPRLFQTVEDLLPLSFTLPYLGPMLENAGAHVFFGRERDPQRHMAVVDNDSPMTGGRFIARHADSWFTGPGTGFAVGQPPYPGGHNPFRQGTYLDADENAVGTASWVPDIPGRGEYAVYVSYASLEGSAEDAEYTVAHAGGRTRFLVNQRIGGGTWIYLGTFLFERGSNEQSGSVTLSSLSPSGGRVTADAVRFGGGMGLVERGGKTGGRPRFMEGARYHLQYSGMPDSLVFDLNGGEDDYRDDYQSRGEWVNFLRGAPYGPNLDRKARGLGIPIDVSLAFHTDAGITGPDSTIGTLSIYSLEGADSTRVFPDGVSRFSNRDLADIVQTEIVRDLRVLYDSTWNRRSLYDGRYSESTRPNVPSMLLELLSHQNFWDMRYGLDPGFRFDASRAIYKGLLKFLADHHGGLAVVQPLPVTHFRAELDGENAVRLSWRPRLDSLEVTAVPDRYVVYMRVDSSGFDNGRLTADTTLTIDSLEPGRIYSFKVAAANDGGESFPSETLSACRSMPDADEVLVVNGFDRVSAPATLVAGDLTGFANFWDPGVPDRRDLGYTGSQFAFDSSSRWRDDDAPGHGASHGDYETRVLAGNTFDFPAVHGGAICSAGYSFSSASDEAVEDGLVDLQSFRVVDLILGEERRISRPRSSRYADFEVLSPAMRLRLREYAREGGSMLLSGAHVGSDLYNVSLDSIDIKAFADSVLHLQLASDYASRSGEVYTVGGLLADESMPFSFNTRLSENLYAVESPDALRPVGEGAAVLARYAENNLGAAVGFRGGHRIVTLGFPLEAVHPDTKRRELIKLVLSYLQGAAGPTE